jgi:hypothetical protein
MCIVLYAKVPPNKNDIREASGRDPWFYSKFSKHTIYYSLIFFAVVNKHTESKKAANITTKDVSD